MDTRNEALTGYLRERGFELIHICIKLQFIICENALLAQHYSLIYSLIVLFSDYFVSSRWTVYNPKRIRIDLIVAQKWPKYYKDRKRCYKKRFPVYAAEYKIDDEPGKYGKNHQFNDFKKDVIRLDQHCEYLDAAFALYYYRGTIPYEVNAFDIKSPEYLFRSDEIEISNPKKMNANFVSCLECKNLI